LIDTYPVDGTIVPAVPCAAEDAREDAVPVHDVAEVAGRVGRELEETVEIDLEETDVRGRHRKNWMLKWTTTSAVVAEATRPPRTAMGRLRLGRWPRKISI
jgi:hypothetical protein